MTPRPSWSVVNSAPRLLQRLVLQLLLSGHSGSLRSPRRRSRLKASYSVSGSIEECDARRSLLIYLEYQPGPTGWIVE